MGDELKADVTLDCTGLLCPMPVVKTKLAIEEMKLGQLLKVISTDKGAKRDFPAYCSETGHKLVHSEENKGSFVFYIRKA